MLAKPTKLLATLCFTLYAILSFCGNLQPVALFASLQLIAVILMLVFYRHELRQTFCQLYPQQKTNSILSLAWLGLVGIAAIHSFLIHNNPNQHLAIGFRISYNLLQVSFFMVLLTAARLDKQFFCKAYAAFTLGFCLLAAVQINALWGTPNPDGFQWLKFPLLNANIRESGMLAATVVIISSVYALTCHTKKQQLAAFLIATFSLSYVIWTGGRMGILTTLLTLLTISITLIFKQPKNLWPHAALWFICLPLAFYIAETFALFSWNGVVRIFNPASSEHFSDPSSGRLEIWRYTFAAIKNHPLIGNGPFSFYFLEARKASGFIYDHPHNMPLQFLLEWGILGTAVIGALLLRIYYQGWRLWFSQKHISTTHTTALGLITMLTLHSLTSATYWSLQPVVILLLAYSCLVHKQTLAKSHGY